MNNITNCKIEIDQMASSTSSHVVSNADANQIHQLQPTINLDQGDPTAYESYWKKVGEKCKTTIYGYESLSYFSSTTNLCWFMEPKLEEQIKILHKLVGNAVVDDHHIVVGIGSSQLYQAALYALTDPLNEPNPIPVVSAAPYYSTYQDITDCVRSGLFRWAGDAHTYDKDGPYIEVVTSPNNPDGFIREPVVNRANGMVVHDLAYLWPQYTPITAPADHDIMLFTMSKCSGHAGSRLGWGLVRDKGLAEKMVKFMMINTIGVSREAQLRAASLLETISTSCQRVESIQFDNFFKHSRLLMATRWKKLRSIVDQNDLLSVPDFPLQLCNFNGDFTEAYPAFAWMKFKEGVDGERMLREHRILTRSGRRFGSGAEYVRVSMLGRDEEIDAFLKRLQNIVHEFAAIQN